MKSDIENFASQGKSGNFSGCAAGLDLIQAAITNVENKKVPESYDVLMISMDGKR